MTGQGQLSHQVVRDGFLGFTHPLLAAGSAKGVFGGCLGSKGPIW
jgi:hypothetical protein